MLETLSPPVPDALMQVIRSFREDPRTDKLDLGIGTFRDETGATPVLDSVKSAERTLWATQESKTYLGPQGDMAFVELLADIVFGPAETRGAVVRGIQTPGGTGAVRLGAELVRLCNPGARVLLGIPTWPNHEPILKALAIPTQLYPHVEKQAVAFDTMMAAVSRAAPGDVVLLHGCCHNPTGADLSREQWRMLGGMVAERGLIPFIDLAYQGIGHGLDGDAEGMREMIGFAGEAIIAVSCSKNFGLYRDRVGALYVASSGAMAAEIAQARLMELARLSYSMPPDHGAAIVRTILESQALTAQWRSELESMRLRMSALRSDIAAAGERGGVDLAFVRRGTGMFALLDLDVAAIAALRKDHGIYMASNGRVNLAGLRGGEIDRFVAALRKVQVQGANPPAASAGLAT